MILCDENVNENLTHLILHCSYYNDIRESYLPKFVELNAHISEIFGNEHLVMLSILDPLHSKLPSKTPPGESCRGSAQLCDSSLTQVIALRCSLVSARYSSPCLSLKSAQTTSVRTVWPRFSNILLEYFPEIK